MYYVYPYKHRCSYDVDVDVCLLDNLRAIDPLADSPVEFVRLAVAVTVDVDADTDVMSLNRGSRIFKEGVVEFGLGLVLDSDLIGVAATDDTDFPVLVIIKDFLLGVFVLFGTWGAGGDWAGGTAFTGLPLPFAGFSVVDGRSCFAFESTVGADVADF